ncbi:hypothetical protein [Nocardia camponoti]|uniref:hypothetical protein n=1 Tax=Nocardia camponoti TaxID=1616106 RepID=UPI0016656D92|nr:hypothetical protein [Nocardia camponoti]
MTGAATCRAGSCAIDQWLVAVMTSAIGWVVGLPDEVAAAPVAVSPVGWWAARQRSR